MPGSEAPSCIFPRLPVFRVPLSVSLPISPPPLLQVILSLFRVAPWSCHWEGGGKKHNRERQTTDLWKGQLHSLPPFLASSAQSREILSFYSSITKSPFLMRDLSSNRHALLHFSFCLRALIHNVSLHGKHIFRGSQGTYYEAEVVDIDIESRQLDLQFPKHAGLSEHGFKLAYDTLIVAVGSCSNTFGIKVSAEPFRILSQAYQAI